MRKTLLLFIFIFVAVGGLSAQYYTNQNKIWAFGYGAGLDFNSGGPVAFATSINAGEGSASVADEAGRLLFYTDGTKVYNRNGAVMPNGGSIVPFDVSSAEQAALIVSVIDQSNKYYVFSKEASGTVGSNHLAYSIVDMSLAGGLGDVVPSSKGIPLDDSSGENMIAIAGNNNNIWVLSHSRSSPTFLSYNLTTTGINTPVLSTAGSFNCWECYNWGMLRASSNRKRIGQVVYKYADTFGTELYDFDPGTGIVSNHIEIDTCNDCYGLEFSPDNSKLYTCSWNSGRALIYQYDLSLTTPAAIRASRYVVTDSVSGGDLKLGPDSKIYFRGKGNRIDCIQSPNLKGVACNYIFNAVSLLPGSYAVSGLPNLFLTPDTANTANVKKEKAFSGIFIYPNPANNTLTITANDKITTISIANTLGQICYSHTCNTNKITIDIADLPKGIYLVKINGSEVRRFVKE